MEGFFKGRFRGIYKIGKAFTVGFKTKRIPLLVWWGGLYLFRVCFNIACVYVGIAPLEVLGEDIEMGVLNREQSQQNTTAGGSSGVTTGETNQAPLQESVQAPEQIQRPESVLSEQTVVETETRRPELVQSIVHQETRVNQETWFNFCLEALNNKYIYGFAIAVLTVGVFGTVGYVIIQHVADQGHAVVVVESIIPFCCYKRGKSKIKPLLLPFVTLISVVLFITLFAPLLPLPLFLITKISLQVVKVFSSLIVRSENRPNSTLALPSKKWKYFKLIGMWLVLVRKRVLSGFVLNSLLSLAILCTQASAPYVRLIKIKYASSLFKRIFVIGSTLSATILSITGSDEDVFAEGSPGTYKVPLTIESEDGIPMRILGRGITSGYSPEPPEPPSAPSAPSAHSANSNSDPDSKSKFNFSKWVCRSLKYLLDHLC